MKRIWIGIFFPTLTLALSSCGPSQSEIEENEKEIASALAHNLVVDICVELVGVGDPDGLFDVEFGPLEAKVFQAEGLNPIVAGKISGVVEELADINIGLEDLGDDLDEVDVKIGAGQIVDLDPFIARLDAFEVRAVDLAEAIDISCQEFPVKVDVPERLD